MRKGIFIALLVILLGGLGFAYWKYYGAGSRPQSELGDFDLDSYKQDATAQNEMDNRPMSFANRANAKSLILNLVGEDFFSAGYFPLTNIAEKLERGEKLKWSKENRQANGKRISQLVSEYDKYVADAAEVHKVSRIIQYGLMGVEHDDSVSVQKAAKTVDASGLFIGLMQASVSTANDTLRRGVLNKQLSKRQVDFFKQKIGKSIDTISAADLKNAEINIHVAAAFLSVLIRNNGLDDLHKVIFCYNRGEFKLKKQGTNNLGIDDLIKHYQGTSNYIGAEYVIRTLGVNGSFDILYNDLKITD